VPAASEAATAVETPEATAVEPPEATTVEPPEATTVEPPEAGVGETYTTVEAARYAMAEAATSEMGDTYAVETHAVTDDCPLGARAVIEAVASEVREPQAVVDIADTAINSMVETVIAEAG
jgi:hypothetical protein